jgi:hypothetical protein
MDDMGNDTNHGKAAWEAVLAAGRVARPADGKAQRLTLTGKRGDALESFWAGRTTAREALDAMKSNTPSEIAKPSAAPVSGCDATFPPEPKKCWLCDGTGEVTNHNCGHDPRRGQKCSESCARVETCVNCWGLGVERG